MSRTKAAFLKQFFMIAAADRPRSQDSSTPSF